jgi:cell division transport system ATP-binding protein
MVRFDRVGLAYTAPRGGEVTEALSGVSFSLARGSFTWLLGPSGAGKSSVLRLMRLARRPTRGEVEVLGVPVSEARSADLAALRRKIGVVFQDVRLLPYLSAFDNVALPLRLARRPEPQLRADVAELLRWVGLEEKAHSLPLTLSGGEQQRVAIARAVVTRPELLIADEPTANLDARQARRVLALLSEMNRIGTTVVVATHSAELVEAWSASAIRLLGGRVASAAEADAEQAEDG